MTAAPLAARVYDASTDLDRALARIVARQAGYALSRAYYDGEHRVTFTSQKTRDQFARIVQTYRCNLMPAVVDAVADRLEVTGFGVEAGPADAGDAAWAIWNANRMDRKAGEIHQELLTCGDAYAVLWPDPVTNAPRIYPQRAAQMAVQYDDTDGEPDRKAWAAKLWARQDGRLRLNLYYPDRLEKYITRPGLRDALRRASAFLPYRGEDGADPWPIASPWGVVPVFHYANNAPIGGMGRSELHDAIPPQDALNATIRNWLTAGEFHALPQRWATGLEVDIDPVTGEPRAPFKPGGLWATADEHGSFGQFEPANMEQFGYTADSHKLDIARVTGTPLYYLHLISDPPSGEALKTLEARFVKKVKDRQTAVGNVHEDMLALALRMAGQGDAVRLSTHWTDAAPRSEREEAETLEIKSRVGVTWRQRMVEFGYSDATIAEMERERLAGVTQVDTSEGA